MFFRRNLIIAASLISILQVAGAFAQTQDTTIGVYTSFEEAGLNQDAQQLGVSEEFNFSDYNLTSYSESTCAEPLGCAADLSCGSSGMDCGCESGWCDYAKSCCGSNWFFKGWLSQGYTANVDNPPSNFNTPLTFNDRADEYQANQLYLILGKEIKDDCCTWDVGGRVDFLYGSDYFFTQTAGIELNQDFSRRWNGDGPRNAGNAALYGLALPQFYGEFFVPIGSGLRAKVGHFYTIFGYESVMAPENFFYSHSYSMQYAEPFTHSGALFSYSPTTCLTFHAGMTTGWDRFDSANGSLGFLFGFNWDNDVSSLAFSMHHGSEESTGDDHRFAYSLVYTRALNNCWTYVFQHDFGTEQNLKTTAGFTTTDAYWYSINQYLYYKYTEDLDLGIRGEWFRDEDNARILGVPLETAYTGEGNYFEVSLGANWRPCDFAIFRPEVRYDWSDLAPIGGAGPFIDFTKKRQWTFAFDFIVKF